MLPQVLRVFHFSVGSLAEGAAALGRVARVVPDLQDAAAAASFIYRVGHPLHGREGLGLLLRSEVVREPLERLDPNQKARVRAALHAESEGGLMTEEESLQALTRRILNKEGRPIQALVKGVVLGGGAAPLALGLEQEFGDLPAADVPRVGEALRHLEVDFGARGKARTMGDGPPSAVALATFLGRHFSTPLLQDDSPGLLSDLLLKRPGWLPGQGSCVPLHLVAAHLADPAGRRYRALAHTRHANLYDEKAGLVINLSSDPLLSPLKDWRKVGMLGANQRPAGLESLVAGVLNNLGGYWRDRDRALGHRLYRAALEIYPDEPTAHLGLALTSQDPALQERTERRALRINPRNPVTHMFLGALHERLGRHQEAKVAYRAALRHSKTNRALSQRIFGRVFGSLWNSEEALVRLGLGLHLLEEGRLDEARSMAESARRWDQTSVPVQAALRLFSEKDE